MDNYKKISNQIFKYMVPYEYFTVFIDEVCNYDNELNVYILDKTAYKRAKFNGAMNNYLPYFKRFYHVSKQTYIDNATTYKGFLTIIRQICKLLNIKYERKILHMFGEYNILYHIGLSS